LGCRRGLAILVKYPAVPFLSYSPTKRELGFAKLLGAAVHQSQFLSVDRLSRAFAAVGQLRLRSVGWALCQQVFAQKLGLNRRVKDSIVQFRSKHIGAETVGPACVAVDGRFRALSLPVLTRHPLAKPQSVQNVVLLPKV
jgi:hypothetical protein